MLHRLVSPLAFVFAALIAATAAVQQPAAPAAQPPTAAPAAPQIPAQNIRGTITAFNAGAKTLSVKTREGQNVTLAVPDTVNVAVHSPSPSLTSSRE